MTGMLASIRGVPPARSRRQPWPGGMRQEALSGEGRRVRWDRVWAFVRACGLPLLGTYREWYLTTRLLPDILIGPCCLYLTADYLARIDLLVLFRGRLIGSWQVCQSETPEPLQGSTTGWRSGEGSTEDCRRQDSDNLIPRLNTLPGLRPLSSLVPAPSHPSNHLPIPLQRHDLGRRRLARHNHRPHPGQIPIPHVPRQRLSGHQPRGRGALFRNRLPGRYQRLAAV